MKVTLRPMAGKVFLDPEMIEEYRGRIIIPRTAQGRDMPHIGTVVAMNGAFLTKKGVRVLPEFKVGDRVIFRKFSALFVDIGSKRLVQVAIKDIEAILVKEYLWSDYNKFARDWTIIFDPCITQLFNRFKGETIEGHFKIE